jgi:RNA polymerase sigma-70 factor (ECF subfamily)
LVPRGAASRETGRETAETAARAWAAVRGHGDVAAFEQLFRQFASELADFAWTYVDTDDDAEEIVQLLFCWLWDRRFVLPEPESVRAYLFAAVRHRAVDAARRRRTEAAFRTRAAQAAGGAADAAAAPSPESELAARDLEHALRDAVRRMPPRCREVYTLRRDHGLSGAEVATALGIAPKTVEIHMARALRLLRECLAPWLEA